MSIVAKRSPISATAEHLSFVFTITFIIVRIIFMIFSLSCAKIVNIKTISRIGSFIIQQAM